MISKAPKSFLEFVFSKKSDSEQLDFLKHLFQQKNNQPMNTELKAQLAMECLKMAFSMVPENETPNPETVITAADKLLDFVLKCR